MTDSKNRKGIYILPSLFTTAGLFFGFYAIIFASQGVFDKAAVGILIAMIMDGLDGRVARLTNTASEFGKEYDSLVDLVAFGLAPGLVVYFWSLQHLGKTGWLISFIFAAATALRLARFNTRDANEKRYFIGLPSPAAAAFVTFWVWSMHEFEIEGSSISIISALIVFFAALMMVSNIKYRSFKDFDAKSRVPFIVLIGLVMIFSLIFFDPPRVLFLMAAGFALSGPLAWLFRYRKGQEKWENIIDDVDEETED
ncbi:MAG: CDP-diacylglycerol--serine O-phosphatidyltransferase [Proteobacteria bacterium]|nr:CDP-diacylglycerol--serine O-phosphatidyltransferase [Pseudomonadota bacterium]